MNKRTFAYLMMSGLFAISFAGCAGKAKARVEKGEMSETMDLEPTKKKYLEVVGIGGADQTLTNSTQRKATSRNAAVVDGQYRLLSMVKGLRLVGGITVEKAIETDSKMQTTVDAELKAAEEVKYEWTKDDGCVVTMRLDKSRLAKMMGVEFE